MSGITNLNGLNHIERGLATAPIKKALSDINPQQVEIASREAAAAIRARNLLPPNRTIDEAAKLAKETGKGQLAIHNGEKAMVFPNGEIGIVDAKNGIITPLPPKKQPISVETAKNDAKTTGNNQLVVQDGKVIKVQPDGDTKVLYDNDK